MTEDEECRALVDPANNGWAIIPCDEAERWAVVERRLLYAITLTDTEELYD